MSSGFPHDARGIKVCGGARLNIGFVWFAVDDVELDSVGRREGRGAWGGTRVVAEFVLARGAVLWEVGFVRECEEDDRGREVMGGTSLRILGIVVCLLD